MLRKGTRDEREERDGKWDVGVRTSVEETLLPMVIVCVCSG